MNRFDLAKKAHMEKKFSEAIDLLEKEIKTQPNNPSVYFNLGLSYKANKQYPKAIWAFEKTLKLQPKDSEAIELIEACYVELDSAKAWKDETGTFQRALIAMGSNFWALLSVILAILSGIFIIAAKRVKVNNKRKWYLGVTVFSVITLFISIANASSAYSYEHSRDYAIAMEKIELVHKADGKNAKVQTLAAGSKVKIVRWNKDGTAMVEAFGGVMEVEKGLKRI